jgi:hypothetical protein
MAKPIPTRQGDELDAEGKQRLERGLTRAFQMPPKSQALVKKQRQRKPKGSGKKPSPS